MWRASQHVVETFAKAGCVEVHWIATSMTGPASAAWLVTATDAERDVLGADQQLKARLDSRLAELGLPEVEHVVVQSQETVDREFQGSWFYAMR